MPCKRLTARGLNFTNSQGALQNLVQEIAGIAVVAAGEDSRVVVPGEHAELDLLGQPERRVARNRIGAERKMT